VPVIADVLQRNEDTPHNIFLCAVLRDYSCG